MGYDSIKMNVFFGNNYWHVIFRKLTYVGYGSDMYGGYSGMYGGGFGGEYN